MATWYRISLFFFILVFFSFCGKKGTNEWNLIIKMVTERNQQHTNTKTSFPVDLIGKIFMVLQNIISFEFIFIRYGQKDALGFNKKYEFQKCYLFKVYVVKVLCWMEKKKRLFDYLNRNLCRRKMYGNRSIFFLL